MVWVAPQAHFPAHSGGTLRTHHLVSAVAQRFPVELVVVGHHSPADVLRDATGAERVHTFEPAAGLRLRWLCLRRGWPVAVGRVWHRDAATLVRDRASGGSLVVLDFVQSDVYRPPGSYVLGTHNAEGALLASMPLTGSPLRRLERRRERRRMAAWEAHAVSTAHGTVVTVSEDDAQTLGRNAVVIPNGATLTAPRDPPRDGTQLFVGSLDYAPNVEAVRWWSTRVWPLLPDGTAPLTVVGRHPEALGPAQLPGVELVGEVDDLEPVYAAARLFVVPLQTGGGTRIKVLEALGRSVPVLTTTRGVAGLPLEHGRHVWTADDPAEFAASLTALATDHDLRVRLARAGRAAVARYDWADVGRAFADLVAELGTRR